MNDSDEQCLLHCSRISHTHLFSNALAEDIVGPHGLTKWLIISNTSRLPFHKKGMHLVTRDVVRECEEGLKDVKIGIFTLNCLHTSAGLTVSTRSCVLLTTR